MLCFTAETVIYFTPSHYSDGHVDKTDLSE
jgi:hypothetical protein